MIKGKEILEKEINSILIEDNKTQPIFDYKECIFEKVFVETPVDTDGDGKLDLIAMYIRRPKETLAGMRIPAIYVANPYMMTCNEDWYVPHNVDKDLEVFKQQNISREDVTYDFESKKVVRESNIRKTAGYASTSPTEEIPLDCVSDWYSYFNTRGYASVFCGGLGTKGSEGFTITGSVEETEAFKAVIDWLNGRCRAFTNREDNIEIKADWCTGNVAMSGKSYLGTMCIAVAATGIEGLKTIIPEAAISNWYEYYRYNGLNSPAIDWQGDDLDILAKYCLSRSLDEDYPKVKEAYEEVLNNLVKEEDRQSGNYNKFWDERNYLNLADKIKASTFIIHGLNDWNVMTNQCIPLWKALEKFDAPRKMMLHQGDHIYIHDLQSGNFNSIMHMWLDYWLYDIENGVMEEVPNVLVQSNVDQDKWLSSTNWPAEKNELKKFDIEEVDEIVNFVDDLSATVYDREKKNLNQWLDELVMSDSIESGHFIKYIGEELESEARISGEIQVSFSAAIDKETAILSAMLVDYGEDNRMLVSQEVAEKDGITWGLNTPKSDVKKFAFEEKPSKYRVISRGWMNAQNRKCVWNKEEIEVGTFYDYSFKMIPMDYTVKPGHRLGVILYGTDTQATQRPFIKTEVKIKSKSISVEIPFVD
ncbi:MAG: Xaa-Pro dipeptidyl-peptidase [Clostridium sp.]|uniref:Xaa-Pro dipeptidyl-peptidase n=1 Tax=Clostridium sp. TaxID=1506 RepID=UPI003067B79F